MRSLFIVQLFVTVIFVSKGYFLTISDVFHIFDCLHSLSLPHVVHLDSSYISQVIENGIFMHLLRDRNRGTLGARQ